MLFTFLLFFTAISGHTQLQTPVKEVLQQSFLVEHINTFIIKEDLKSSCCFAQVDKSIFKNLNASVTKAVIIAKSQQLKEKFFTLYCELISLGKLDFAFESSNPLQSQLINSRSLLQSLLRILYRILEKHSNFCLHYPQDDRYGSIFSQNLGVVLNKSIIEEPFNSLSAEILKELQETDHKISANQYPFLKDLEFQKYLKKRSRENLRNFYLGLSPEFFHIYLSNNYLSSEEKINIDHCIEELKLSGENCQMPTAFFEKIERIKNLRKEILKNREAINRIWKNQLENQVNSLHKRGQILDFYNIIVKTYREQGFENPFAQQEDFIVTFRSINDELFLTQILLSEEKNYVDKVVKPKLLDIINFLKQYCLSLESFIEQGQKIGNVPLELNEYIIKINGIVGKANLLIKDICVILNDKYQISPFFLSSYTIKLLHRFVETEYKDFKDLECIISDPQYFLPINLLRKKYPLLAQFSQSLSLENQESSVEPLFKKSRGE